jgi:hypothetical protein
MELRDQAIECYSALRSASISLWEKNLAAVPFLKNAKGESIRAALIVMAASHLTLAQAIAVSNGWESDEDGPYYSRWFVDSFARGFDEDFAKAVICVSNSVGRMIAMAAEEADDRGLADEDRARLMSIWRETAVGSEFLELALMDETATDALKPEVVGLIGRTLLAESESAIEGTEFHMRAVLSS